jgi:choline kinase/phosphatidylglycerophosphate synthase
MLSMEAGLGTPTEGVRARIGVILAAGRSERLVRVTGGGSKAVVRVGGLSLVERAVRTMLAAGLRRVVVVVGFDAGPVAALANRIAPGHVRVVYAEGWELGNGASLAAAEPLTVDEPLFLLATTDHLFGDGALEALLRLGRPGVLVDNDPGPDAWAEGTRVRLERERAVAFSKELVDPSIDCGAFLLPPGVFQAQRRAQARGDATLAGAVTELGSKVALEAVELPRGCWWQDIDTPEDLRRARRLLRRGLTKSTDGPVSRYLNRPVSTRLSLAIAPLRIPPNALSVLAMLVALAGAWLLAGGAGIGGAILVHLASILDGVDGESARLQVRTSPGGALLDGVLDRLGDLAILAGLAVWALDLGSEPSRVAVLAVVATAGSMLSMATKDRIAALFIPPAPERQLAFFLGGRDGRLLVITLFALLGRPVGALIGVVVVTTLTLGARLLVIYRNLRAI